METDPKKQMELSDINLSAFFDELNAAVDRFITLMRDWVNQIPEETRQEIAAIVGSETAIKKRKPKKLKRLHLR